MIKIAIFASGSGTNAENIIRYFKGNDRISVDIVLSNKAQAKVLERATGLGVESMVFDRDIFYNSDKVVNILAERGIDYIILAGFLWLIPINIIKSYEGRIINIHPSLLPRHGGKGMYGDNVHRAVIESGDKQTGITIHTVDEIYDNGRIIAQFTTPVGAQDTPESVASRVHELEYKHFPQVIEQELLKKMRLLLISNSTNAGEKYLEYPKAEIKSFLDTVDEVVFIPYAAVTFSYDDYLKKVSERFSEIGIPVVSLHNQTDPIKAINEAKAIVVGGGNTFHLLKTMQQQGVLEIIRQRVLDGIPYIGWSAGSNVACPTICTTNDMPIVEPKSFAAANLIKFQINPHYTDAHPEGHAGETREQRIEEFIAANRTMTVAGLREGCMLRIEDGKIALIGPRPIRIFRYGESPREVNAGDNLSFLL